MIFASGIAALLALSRIATVAAETGLGCESAFARCNVAGEVCLADGNVKAWGWSTPLLGVGKSVSCELWIRAPKCDTKSAESKMIGSVTVDTTTNAISVHVSDADYVLSGVQAYSGADITPSSEKEITSTRFNPAVSDAVIAAAFSGSHDFLISHVYVCPADLVLPEDAADTTHRSLTFFWNWWTPTYPPPAPAPTYKFDWWCWICGTCKSSPPPPPPTHPPVRPPPPQPVCAPTPAPTEGATLVPTMKPTKKPTAKPTRRPTIRPTLRPTTKPTRKPTVKPTRRPTIRPTKRPTTKPTRKPTVKPTRRPTIRPTKRPTTMPTRRPTVRPTARPVARPSSRPVGFW